MEQMPSFGLRVPTDELIYNGITPALKTDIQKKQKTKNTLHTPHFSILIFWYDWKMTVNNQVSGKWPRPDPTMAALKVVSALVKRLRKGAKKEA